LHKKIEETLDQGSIAILPVPSDSTAARWKCVFVDETLRRQTCFIRTRERVVWNVRFLFLFPKSYSRSLTDYRILTVKNWSF
jgi:hypothetical protein